MGNLFGKRKPPSRVTEQDKAILQLKQQRDKLKQYQKKIQVTLGKERDLARQLLKEGKREKAKLLLRKKRFQENLIEKTDGQLDNIERMVHDLEFAQIEVQVVNGLKEGNASLKKMHEVMSIEDVERIMDETQEAVEYQNEIDSILAGGLTQEDEDDVLAELDSIVEEQLPKAVEEGNVPELPDVPADKIQDQEKPSRERKQVEERQAVLAS